MEQGQEITKIQTTSDLRFQDQAGATGEGGGEGGANTFTSMLSLQPNGLMCPLNEC